MPPSQAGEYRRLVNGLKRVLATHVPACQREQVSGIKQRGLHLFAPELGGSYAVFQQRPLSKDIVDYCCADVAFFPLLEQELYDRLSAGGKEWVARRSRERVEMCRGPAFKHGREMALAPA